MKPLAQFEESLGIQLPSALKAFLTEPRELEYFSVPMVDDFTSLNDLFPGIPTRTLPFLTQSDGSMIGLYCPRGEDKYFIVYFSLGESQIVPLTADVDRFFADPDLWSPDNEVNDDDFRCDAPDAWKHLLYNFKSIAPELELLKPLSLNSSYDGDADQKTFKKLAAKFGSALPQAEIVRGHYRNATSPLDREWWFSLAERFVVDGHFTEAIQALENCQVVHFIHPHYGSIDEEVPSFDMWTKLTELFERLTPLVQEHGDGVDRVTVPHQLLAAERMASEEEADDELVLERIEIEVETGLVDVADSSEDELLDITGVVDGHEIAHFWIASTSSSFFIQVGEVAAIATFEFEDSVVPIGEVLQRIAFFLRDDYLPYPQKYRTKGAKLEDVQVLSFIWSGKSAEYWEVVTNFQDEN